MKWSSASAAALVAWVLFLAAQFINIDPRPLHDLLTNTGLTFLALAVAFLGADRR